MSITIPAIHIEAWQLAFVILYACSCGLAFLVFCMNPFGGGPGIIAAIFMALLWPLCFLLAFILPLVEFTGEKISEWKESRKKKP